MPLLRVALVAAALVTAAWFGLGAHQAYEIAQVNRTVGGLTGQLRLSHAASQQARERLSSAAWLNPDREIDLLRARVALLSRHRTRATAILQRVVAAEPENVDAWYGIATSAPDRATVLHAIAVVGRLDPRL